MSNNDIWDALGGSDNSPIFKFANPGDKVKGIIVEPPVTLPLKEYKSDQPKIGADGKPVMQVLLILATDQPLDDDHDGRYRVYVDKPGMKSAVKRALTSADVMSLDVGGELELEFTDYQETRSGVQAKAFVAIYAPAAPADDPWGGPIGVGELGESGVPA